MCAETDSTGDGKRYRDTSSPLRSPSCALSKLTPDRVNSSASLTRAAAAIAASRADDSAMDVDAGTDDVVSDADGGAEAANEFVEFSMASGTLVSLRWDNMGCCVNE